MIPAKDLWTVEKIGHPFTSAPMTLDETRAKIGGRQGYRINRVRTCLCCGKIAWPNGRCQAHQDRNPCVVEGCKRTRRAHGYLSSRMAVCGEHYKAFVRPGSRDRRVHNSFFRKAKQMGLGKNDRWPDALARRYWVFWDLLLRRIISRSKAPDGALDEDEIKKMFGWD